MKTKKTDIDGVTIRRLAAAAGLDPRTVKRAVNHGIDSLKAEVDRERLREAATKLDVRLR